MIEVVTLTEVVTNHEVETLAAVDTEYSAVETAGSDVVLTVADAAPEVIEVS